MAGRGLQRGATNVATCFLSRVHVLWLASGMTGRTSSQ